MIDHRADVEDTDDMNTDKLFEAMEKEFGNINGRYRSREYQKR